MVLPVFDPKNYFRLQLQYIRLFERIDPHDLDSWSVWPLLRASPYRLVGYPETERGLLKRLDLASIRRQLRVFFRVAGAWSGRLSPGHDAMNLRKLMIKMLVLRPIAASTGLRFGGVNPSLYQLAADRWANQAIANPTKVPCPIKPFSNNGRENGPLGTAD
jgi:hypothetical protein